MTPYRPGLPPKLPAEVNAGSAVGRLLFAHRGTRDGLTTVELASALFRPEAMVLRQLAALIAALARLGSSWRVWQDGDAWGLECPVCPRPAARQFPKLGEPQLVSIEDLRGEFEA